MPHRYRWVVLLMASYFFYMAYQPAYGLILLGSTTLCWIFAAAIAREEDKPRKKLLLITGILIDGGILFTFKYAGFFSDLVTRFSETSSGKLEAAAWVLPIGISFYTFKSLSYLIDVYRRVSPPEPHFGYFATYVSFFPQLIAGPIERANELLPQLRIPVKTAASDVTSGLSRIAWGYCKKLVIADTVGLYVQFTFNDISAAGGTQLYVCLLLFAVQLYADFSGYCDIAIGTARLFGIRLSENFNQPYLATSISDYWNRWHMTLTAWVRDYLFMPLNRGVTAYVLIYLNTILIFLFIGLWHGASLSFLAFGLVHGVLAVMQTVIRRMPGLPSIPGLAGTWMRRVWTFHLLILSGVVFRAADFAEARSYYTRMFSHLSDGVILNGFSSYTFGLSLLVIGMFVLSVRLPAGYQFKYPYAFITGVALLVLLLGRNNADAFIYFQF